METSAVIHWFFFKKNKVPHPLPHLKKKKNSTPLHYIPSLI
jgi:hypothetical protein